MASLSSAAYLEKCLAGTSLVLAPDLIDCVLLHGHLPAHPRILHFGGLTRLGLWHLRDVEPVEIGWGVLQPVRIHDEEINDTVPVQLMCLLQSRGAAIAGDRHRPVLSVPSHDKEHARSTRLPLMEVVNERHPFNGFADADDA
ncbi:hypothetical protein AAII07_56735 [Microvirga sp. 0TCS3.31]